MEVLAGSEGARRAVSAGTSQRFVSATERLEDGTPVVSVVGDVDLATVPTLERTLLGVTGDRTPEVIVDLTACSFLDSRGLGALIATQERLERSNGRLALVISRPAALRIFQITRSDELFEIYPSLSAATERQSNGNGYS